MKHAGVRPRSRSVRVWCSQRGARGGRRIGRPEESLDHLCGTPRLRVSHKKGIQSRTDSLALPKEATTSIDLYGHAGIRL